MATTASWAMYGAAKEWVQTAKRCPPEEIVDTVNMLVAPIFTTIVAEPRPASAWGGVALDR